MKNLRYGLFSLIVLVLSVLSGCASYSGYGLNPGESTEQQVIETMGEPAMRWQDPDGRQQLAYPRGPEGMQTFMAHIRPDGRLERIEPVLDTRHFALIRNGQSDQAEVLRLLGPPEPRWTEYFKARDELVWEWRFCNDWNEVAKFDVLFDATTGIVRTTYQRTDLDDDFMFMWHRRSRSRSCAH